MQLLLDREPELRERDGISFRITGIASRRMGWIADPNGLDLEGRGFSRAEKDADLKAALAAEVDDVGPLALSCPC